MVKCSECGFLALRNRHTRLLVEVEIDMRTSGYFPAPIETGGKELYDRIPRCVAGVKEFYERRGLDGKQFLEVISQERDCEHFYEWRQGFTPKEHMDMWMQELVTNRL